MLSFSTHLPVESERKWWVRKGKELKRSIVREDRCPLAREHFMPSSSKDARKPITSLGLWWLCYCAKFTSQWWHFNDAIATPVKPQDVVVRNAYLLFYVRKSYQLPQKYQAAAQREQ